jgi:hypothetical protein
MQERQFSFWCSRYMVTKTLMPLSKGKVHPRTSHEGAEREQRYSCTLSLTSGLEVVGGQRHAPAALSWERSGTHRTGGWVGTTAGLEGCGKSRPHQNSIPGTFSP